MSNMSMKASQTCPWVRLNSILCDTNSFAQAKLIRATAKVLKVVMQNHCFSGCLPDLGLGNMELGETEPANCRALLLANLVQRLLYATTLEFWGLCLAILVLIFVVRQFSRACSPKVLLLDFGCFNPPQRLKVSRAWMIDCARKSGVFTEQSIDFMVKIGANSGISTVTAIPDAGIKMLKECDSLTPAQMRHGVPLEGRHEEADMVAFSTIEALLAKTGVKPSEIGAVITACDCFNPVPSMSAKIVNHFKLSHHVLTYSMTGMGCANGGISVDLARHLLSANPETLCLIFNHENLSAGGYIGNDHSMLMPYCLFRMSGAAILLSNRKCDRARAKYELNLVVRTHIGAEDEAHTCIMDAVDSEGIPGIRINKAVVPSAAKALKRNLTRLGPRVLPIMELVKALWVKGYRPDFKKAFEHFLIQTGGKAVLDAIQKALDLPEHQMRPSRDSLLRFANTSGASNWYSLLALESGSGVKKGDRILGLMFGAGFKAVSVVWRARRDVHEEHPLWRDTDPKTQRAFLDVPQTAAAAE